MAILAALLATVAPTPVADQRPATAATATECPAITDSIGRLYEAYFLRQPDSGGRSFWVGEMQRGRGLLDISDFFSVSTEFQTRYARLTNAQFVAQIYRNVLGRTPDPAGSAYWVGQLDTGVRSRGEVMLNFSESEEFVRRTGTSPPLAGYFSWYPAGTTFACGSDTFALATNGRPNVDVFAVHFPSSRSAGGWVSVSNTDGRISQSFVPFGHFHLNQAVDTEPHAGDTISVAADAGIGIMVVSYGGTPLPAFEERAGWGAGERPPTAGEFIDDLNSAVAIADTFWHQSFTGAFGGTYDPPAVTGLYDGSLPTAPFCGRFQLLENNAFYCPVDHSVAWDVGLMAEGYLFGDAWVYLVVAHEWGHAIQARIDPSNVWVGGELQADCFAGATLYGSSAATLFTNGAGDSLVFEEGDQAELVAGLTALGDKTPWTDFRSHGDAEQRIEAFDLGRDGGIAGCLPVENDPNEFRRPASSLIFS